MVSFAGMDYEKKFEIKIYFKKPLKMSVDGIFGLYHYMNMMFFV